MRIGEVAGAIGVSADTVRFYERSGLLPRPARGPNGYREYGAGDVERLHLLVELRRLDVPLQDAARIAGWCQTGHCEQTTTALPSLLRRQRDEIAERIRGLQRLEQRLGNLERHVSLAELPMAGAVQPCCAAAGAIEALSVQPA